MVLMPVRVKIQRGQPNILIGESAGHFSVFFEILLKPAFKRVFMKSSNSVYPAGVFGGWSAAVFGG